MDALRESKMSGQAIDNPYEKSVVAGEKTAWNVKLQNIYSIIETYLFPPG